MTTTDDRRPNGSSPLLAEFPPATREAWRAAADKLLKGAPFDKVLRTATPEGITLEPIYWPDDLAGLGHVGALPGEPPFVRSARPPGVAAQAWAVAQELDAAEPTAFNQALRHDLGRGQTAVSLRLHPGALLGQEGGRPVTGGTMVASLADLETALAEVDPTRQLLLLWSGGAGLAAAGLLAALARRRGFPLAALQGSLGADPLTEWAVTGQAATDVPTALDGELAAAARWACAQAPGVRVVTVEAHRWHDVGAHAAEELAVALAAGAEYLRALTRAGLSPDQAAARVGFSFGAGTHVFMELAKLRAGRWLWDAVSAAFGASAESRRMWVHVRTSGWNLTGLDPHVNLLRATIAAFAAAAGGADAIHVAPFDAAVRSSDEFSRRIARNIQLVLQEESRLAHVVDPAGGSWYLESLTDSLARRAWELFQQLEAAGGLAAALAAGLPQGWVSRTSAARRQALATRRDVLVGVNQYANPAESPLPPRPVTLGRQVALNDDPLPPAPDAVTAMAEALLAGQAVAPLLAGLRAEAPAGGSVPSLPAVRATSAFEALRRAVDHHAARVGRRPAAVLANLGPAAQHRARADFSKGFLQVGGFDVLDGPGHDDPAAVGEAAARTAAPVVVICSTDDTYPDLVPPLVQALRRSRPTAVVVLAGYPKDQVEMLRSAGVDLFIHLRADIVETLTELARRLGVNI